MSRVKAAFSSRGEGGRCQRAAPCCMLRALTSVLHLDTPNHLPELRGRAHARHTHQGSGASVPKTAEEALAAGYTQDQIDEYSLHRLAESVQATRDAARATMMSLMFPAAAGDGAGDEAAFASAFKKFDSDGSGELSEGELARAFADLATALLTHAEGIDADVKVRKEEENRKQKTENRKQKTENSASSGAG